MKFEGLTTEQVKEKEAAGLVNNQQGRATKSVGTIIATNVLTLFNFINLVLGILVIRSGNIIHATFLLIAIANLIIGIVQEIRAKIAVDKLSIISAPEATVIRDGAETKIPVHKVVQSDVCVLSSGFREERCVADDAGASHFDENRTIGAGNEARGHLEIAKFFRFSISTCVSHIISLRCLPGLIILILSSWSRRR